MLYKPGSPQEREIIGPPVARRPATEAATVAVLGSKLDRLTALVENFQPSSALVTAPTPMSDAVAPVDAIEPDLSPEAMAKMTAAEFRTMSALRWSDAFGHLDGGSPYSRAYGTPGPLAPFRADGS